MNIDYYITYDLPVPYRNIKIYPATVKDYSLFNVCAQCFTIDKNSFPDPKIISMSNLEYLFYETQNNPETHPYLLWFDRVLSIVLKDDVSFNNIEGSLKRFMYDENKKPFFMILEDKYTYRDFEKIKEIICEQNLVELPDLTISKEVRDAMEEAKAYKAKISGAKPASLEDYIISLSIVTGWSFEYIHNMPIRKFTKSISRYDNLIHYKIYLEASMSGMVEFKDKSFIKHWLTNLEEDKFKDVSVDLETIQDTVSLESAKK